MHAPAPEPRSPAPWKAVAGVGLAVLAMAVGARLDVPVPGSPVPQSLQTLAVVLAGATLGGRLGTIAMVAYLALGAAGLPIFAGGSAGWRHLLGPTGGFLLGFVAAAGGVGWMGDSGRIHRFIPSLLIFVAGHGVILALGMAWLALDLGLGQAFQAGVLPFLWGGLVKSAVAAAAVAWSPLTPPPPNSNFQGIQALRE